MIDKNLYQKDLNIIMLGKNINNAGEFENYLNLLHT